MKKIARNGAAVALISPLKRTPRDAEVELAHIESTLRIIARSHFPALPLGPAYWRARVREIHSLYTLLPSHEKRLLVLGREIDTFESTLATAASPAPRQKAA